MSTKHSNITSRWNADLIDQNYEHWHSNPEILSPEWRAFFEGFEIGQDTVAGLPELNSVDSNNPDSDASKQSRAIGLIYAYSIAIGLL